MVQTFGFSVNGAAQAKGHPALQAAETAGDVRLRVRRNLHRTGTAGLANGYLQANLVVLPLAWARDFARYCIANPAPCPVVGVSDPGDPTLGELGADLDIRTDVPQYNLYRNGVFATHLDTLKGVWSEDLVAFALGCSYTFERALMESGLRLRHIDEGKVVPMFRTDKATVEAGPFAGGMVVSMRPMTPEQAAKASDISAEFPHAHGRPVHIGDPAALGIRDIGKPDWGHAVAVRDGEVPVFWACGVTPQVAIETAGPPVCYTHRPGHMLITDLKSGEEAMNAWKAAQDKLHNLGRL